MKSLNDETCRRELKQYISRFVMASLDDSDYGDNLACLEIDEHV
jgi:hypothetical protein